MNHPPASLKAVIFDFDGVILESANIKTQAFLELFAAYPQHQPQILAYHLANAGLSRYHKFEWIYHELLHQPFTPTERERLGTAFSAIVLDQILRCPFVPGALETLQSLHGRYLTFVASGTPQEELDLIVRQRHLAPYFNEVWGTPLKKEQIIQGILQRFNLRPAEIIFIGDGTSDYRAALTTGTGFIARDTPEMQPYWQTVNVQRIPDLHHLERFFAQPISAAGIGA
jgi:phosphoglycolate phosphatase-like HAD superfamily hydrolase